VCGFAGFYNKDARFFDSIKELKSMGEAIFTRGPDSSGEWIDESGTIGFSHRRLSIVDLSSAGHQPMVSYSRRFTIAFNGEIYNHLELRTKLEEEFSDIIWLGNSDTETILMCFDYWGIQSTIEMSVGMFAFSVWDNQENKLTLCRDRLGEKPLYYGWQDGTFLFGSELKAIKAHHAFRSEINRDSIALLLRHSCIPAPYSIYKGIKKLLPGYLLEIDFDKNITIETQYWSLKDIVSKQKNLENIKSKEEVVDDLNKLLTQSIKEQMIADVPLGAFLSGGVDSSTVVALMQSQSDKPIKTFSIGFNEEGFDEAIYAKSIATHLGTDHTELYVSPEDAMDVIPLLADLYDEPFSDSSQIPTFLLAKMTKEHVTVSLSGDAGDELFCGYNRYLLTQQMWGKLSITPMFIRRILSSILLSVSVSSWSRINKVLPAKFKLSDLGTKMHKAGKVLTANTVSELYKGLVSHCDTPEALVIGATEPRTVLNDPIRSPELTSDIEQMMALDTLSYLPDDILTKVDRACMGVSLEGRVPFLNHKIVEFAWDLPLDYKLNNGTTKWCLKEVLYRYVPKSLIDRPKMGFGIPINSWLRGPLCDWADKLLDEERLIKEGFFESKPIVKMWTEHKLGKRDWQDQLWDVLMFQSWYEKHHKQDF